MRTRYFSVMPNSFAIHRFNSGRLKELGQGGQGTLRVDVVGDVEGLACVGRVDFEVHGWSVHRFAG